MSVQNYRRGIASTTMTAQRWTMIVSRDPTIVQRAETIVLLRHVYRLLRRADRDSGPVEANARPDEGIARFADRTWRSTRSDGAGGAPCTRRQRIVHDRSTTLARVSTIVPRALGGRRIRWTLVQCVSRRARRILARLCPHSTPDHGFRGDVSRYNVGGNRRR
jgi:hypothetical protein